MMKNIYIFFYNFFLLIFFIFFIPIIFLFILLSGKQIDQLKKRFFLKIDKLKLLKINNCIWIHALSVGELLSSDSLLKILFLVYGRDKLFLTVSTKSGYNLARKYIGLYIGNLYYFPFDIPWVIYRFISVVLPKKIIFIETDMWPNILFFLKKLRIYVYLINNKVSKRSYNRIKLFKFLTKNIYSLFDIICVQTFLDKKLLSKIGVYKKNVFVSGNIKFDCVEKFNLIEELEKIKKVLKLQNYRPVIIIGSSHPGEEKIFLDVLIKLFMCNIFPILILVPRNIVRCTEIYDIFDKCNFSLTVKIYSKLFINCSPKNVEYVDVIVVDKIGVLKNLYMIADIAFVGGSLVNFGGHNILEPGASSKPVLFGPYISDFKFIAKSLQYINGGICVKNENELIKKLFWLLSNLVESNKIGHNAYVFFTKNKGSIEKTLYFIS